RMLGVLESTRRVMDAARDVSIDQDAVEHLASRLADRGVEAPAWRVWPHWWEDSDRAADYVLVLDALNFCFWGEPRWRVEYEGRVLDGYWALAACLRHALEADVPLLDPEYLASFDEFAAAELFEGEAEIPLLAERIANLREVGRGLLDAGGSFAEIVRQANGSGEALVAEVVRRFPSFDDVATYDATEVRLYKRAQILVSDLHGIYGGQSLGAFSDLDRLTAFADYKIPQVLREADILVYTPALADTVDRQQLIPPGDPREVEIRASTVWGCELLRQALERRRPGPPLRAFEVDWLLWSDAQGRTISRPYHRTRTIFY
ncbi:MAG TPA: queuosine salvage family protein, partial [Chloroflexota bacterium]|nr:queuosine salvage family protein [Chloroflexota bacterium]